VEVVFDLGARGHIEAGAAEQRFDAQARARDRMQPAAFLAAAWKRHVDAADSSPRPTRPRSRTALPATIPPSALLFRAVVFLAGAAALIGGKRTERFQLLGERAFLAEPAHAHVIERDEVA